MGLNPPPDLHADGGQLFFAARASIAPGRSIHPNARASRNAEGTNAESRCRCDHGLLELPHVPDNVAPDSFQIENGITNDLARAAIGDIAGAVAMMIFLSLTAQQMLGDPQVLAFSDSATRSHVSMS